MYLIFDTIDEFNTWHNLINLALNYPDENSKTQNYTGLLPTKNGENICMIDKSCPQEFINNRIVYEYEYIHDLLLEN
jgi:hypothetical protein